MREANLVAVGAHSGCDFRFHKSYTVQGVAALLKRHGWSCQVPARRVIEWDEAAVAGWVKETWPSVEGP